VIDDQRSAGATDRRRDSWFLLVVFLLVSFGGAWLIAMPLWTSGDGLASPLAPLLLPAMMYTPAVAVFAVALIGRRHPRSFVRDVGMWPLRPLRRVLGLAAVGIVGAPLLIAAGIVVAVGLGWVHLDLTHLSGFRETLRAAAGDVADAVPLQLLVVVQLASIPIGALLNGLLTFGEEVGWRGWLLPWLRTRLGTWPALMVSGAIWGAWHSPLILLGYDFGRPDASGVLLMVIASVLVGVLFGWLRLRSQSIWPAVFAHGSLNASANLVVLFSSSAPPVDPTLAGPLGVGTWIASAVLITVLVLLGQFASARLTAQRTPSAD